MDLNIEGISYKYHSNWVLDQLKLELRGNQITGLVGMNGSGKTTLFNCLAGNLKSDLDLKSKLKVVLTETTPVFPPYLKGSEYLSLFSRNNPGFDSKSWAKMFDLPYNDMIDEYSTGNKKKLSILASMALNPDLWLLDEPYNGLDLESGMVLTELLLNWKSEKKLVWVSSHILGSLTNLCDEIHYLRAGQIARVYFPHEYFQLEGSLKLGIQDQMQGKIQNWINTIQHNGDN